MSDLHEYFRLPEKRGWLLWVIVAWCTVLFGPFVVFGEDWGMIFYLLTWPLSEALKTLYEDLGVAPYVILVSLTQIGCCFLVALVVNNAMRIRRENRNKTQPPTALPL